MIRLFQRLTLALALAGASVSAYAFSLNGPFASDYAGAVWQVLDTGYQLPGDIGGPMNVTEEYRWNIKTITYGFDSSFIGYFGQRGVDEVEKAIAILNDLPAFSKMSSSLSEFPLDTRRDNYQAQAMGILDLKSQTMGIMLEEMGLASPERFVWCLRSRTTFPTFTNYFVIMRNFDPQTLLPTPYVNGVLYTYSIFEFGDNPRFNDAVEILVDPLSSPFTSVASSAGGVIAVNPLGGGIIQVTLNTGQFYTGLTRDDVGGLRYLYAGKGPYVGYNYENLLPDATATGAVAWSPGTSGSNAVSIALRPGVDKIVFKRMKNESGIGNFIALTNQYTDTYVTNSRLRTQKIQRALVAPDVLFAAADLGVNAGGSPVLLRRTVLDGWANNSLLNSAINTTGPGVIQPQIMISYSTVGPFIWNQFPGFMSEATAAGFFGGWGSFDGTTNPPVVYPLGVGGNF